jgi:hypothetical protein
MIPDTLNVAFLQIRGEARRAGLSKGGVRTALVALYAVLRFHPDTQNLGEAEKAALFRQAACELLALNMPAELWEALKAERLETGGPREPLKRRVFVAIRKTLAKIPATVGPGHSLSDSVPVAEASSVEPRIWARWHGPLTADLEDFYRQLFA